MSTAIAGESVRLNCSASRMFGISMMRRLTHRSCSGPNHWAAASADSF